MSERAHTRIVHEGEEDDTITMEGGTGIVVALYTGADGAPVIQIDTPEDTDLHETIRVYVNDALAEGWRES